ncbi:hypothetical protein DVS28_a2751 [Euzebya pacifica]|uniref:Uncharacterized protein n=1 Tax=Euzebya pacifica TaxID=1608957 RepID=A0A346XYY3_9ACTN|nr:hypothetical protein DVS28_a2751 [Euzebya pacifica]
MDLPQARSARERPGVDGCWNGGRHGGRAWRTEIRLWLGCRNARSGSVGEISGPSPTRDSASTMEGRHVHR